jgi:hypothetical protein
MAYLDESGDLGWKLDAPFQAGGSARYFVIAIAVGMNEAYRRVGKVVDRLHKVQGWTSRHEKKWATISPGAREAFCQLAAAELAGNDQIRVMIAVYHKEHAPDFLRGIDVRAAHPEATEAEIAVLEAKYKGRAHLVYAMMVAETLAEHLPAMDTFTFCPDELNEGQRALDHILTYRLLIQQQRNLVLKRVDRVAAMQRGLDFADMCAGAAFESYQRNDTRYLEILRPYVVIKDFTGTVPAEQPAALEMPLPAGSIFQQSSNGDSSVA